MLRFSHAELMVNSLLSMSTSQLVAVCCDAAASHVITAFVNSHATGTQRSQLYTRLQVTNYTCLVVYVCISLCLHVCHWNYYTVTTTTSPVCLILHLFQSFSALTLLEEHPACKKLSNEVIALLSLE